jgi:hypothetical protein
MNSKGMDTLWEETFNIVTEDELCIHLICIFVVMGGLGKGEYFCVESLQASWQDELSGVSLTDPRA